ncbi:MAG TPA: alpha/beta hydrolase, partial [Nocardioides sp.]|jgi:polyhydroxyalkanoate synthase|nr:alpha/beta hydrolase [Nocardioides sp.]
VPLLTGSQETRFEIVPGGHLGMLTGREARTGTWPVLDAWFDEWTEHVAEPAPAATRRRTSRKAAAKRAPTRKSPPKRAATQETPAPLPEIGSDPRRRYGSAESRALGRTPRSRGR